MYFIEYKKKLVKNMKSNVLIGIMTVVWLALMANIIWQGTDGEWQVEDADKIGQLEVAKYTNQIIVVSVSDEGDAQLYFYENMSQEGDTNDSDQWELILETEANVGKNGLGKTREGDGKTPIGVFRFTKAFGILKNPGAKMEYTQVNENHYWVDDGASKYYNQFISVNQVIQDWRSAENIYEYDESYNYVLATSYNSECIAGRGSAVFLHCASDSADATAGCVAIPEIYMKEIIMRVEPQCVIIIDRVENVLEY